MDGTRWQNRIIYYTEGKEWFEAGLKTTDPKSKV